MFLRLIARLTCLKCNVDVTFRYVTWSEKDANGKTTYEPTWKREIPRCYCLKKECILRRYPYFWKGMIEVQEDVRQQLKEGHKKLLKEVLHRTTDNKYGLLTKCEVKMAGYWPSSFFACLWTET